MGIAYISKLAPLTVIDIDIILMINEDDNNPGDRGDLGYVRTCGVSGAR